MYELCTRCVHVVYATQNQSFDSFFGDASPSFFSSFFFFLGRQDPLVPAAVPGTRSWSPVHRKLYHVYVVECQFKMIAYV